MSDSEASRDLSIVDRVLAGPASVNGCNPAVPAPVDSYKIVAYSTAMTMTPHHIIDDLADYSQAVLIAANVSLLPGIREANILCTVPGMVVNRLEAVYVAGHYAAGHPHTV
jgi:hypothetical protein